MGKSLWFALRQSRPKSRKIEEEKKPTCWSRKFEEKAKSSKVKRRNLEGGKLQAKKNVGWTKKKCFKKHVIIKTRKALNTYQNWIVFVNNYIFQSCFCYCQHCLTHQRCILRKHCTPNSEEPNNLQNKCEIQENLHCIWNLKMCKISLSLSPPMSRAPKTILFNVIQKSKKSQPLLFVY